MTNDKATVVARLQSAAAESVNTSGQVVAGYAVGRRAGRVRWDDHEWIIEWNGVLRLCTQEFEARLAWDALTLLVAGPLAVLLDGEVKEVGATLPPAGRAARLAERPARPGCHWRGTRGRATAGDPEGVLLTRTDLASAITWRRWQLDWRDDDAGIAQQEAADLLLYPPGILADIGAGPPEGWLGSPHGPVVGLLRRAEDRAEALLRDRIPAVRRVAEALSAARPRQLSFDQLELLLAGS